MKTTSNKLKAAKRQLIAARNAANSALTDDYRSNATEEDHQLAVVIDDIDRLITSFVRLAKAAADTD